MYVWNIVYCEKSRILSHRCATTNHLLITTIVQDLLNSSLHGPSVFPFPKLEFYSNIRQYNYADWSWINLQSKLLYYKQCCFSTLKLVFTNFSVANTSSWCQTRFVWFFFNTAFTILARINRKITRKSYLLKGPNMFKIQFLCRVTLISHSMK